MAKYLLQVTYTSEAWATQIQNPQNRVEVIQAVLERLGGRLECAYYAFGEYDAVAIIEMPDNVSMAASALAFAAGGAQKTIRTTPLLTIEAGVEAMRKASSTGYRPPGR